MKVHIVTEGNRIKMRISEKIIKYNTSPVNYTLSYTQDSMADINFYVCYNVFSNFNQKTKKDVGYITHVHNNSIAEHTKDLGKSFSLFNNLDAYLHMSHNTLQFFSKEKYHNVVYGGCELQNFKPTITLGIIQNGEVIGKGTKFLIDLINNMDLTNFKFVFCGVGWENVVNVFSSKNIRLEYLKNIPYDQFQSVYEKIDYLFIPSLWEGGPMAVLEAMACQIPIISADTGWTKEIISGYFFKPGDVIDCKLILEMLEREKIHKYKNTQFFSYETFCERLYLNFCNILENK